MSQKCRLQKRRAILLVFGVAFLNVFTDAAAPAPNPRAEQQIVSGWKFHLGDARGAEAEAFDDEAWASIDLPHTWNARDGEDGGNNYFRGTGWYRKRFEAQPAWADREVYLQFDGVNRRADVYLNGHLLGTHLGGFARFRFDATPYLKTDAENVVAVRVNNEGNGIAPTRADFTFFGGIYRGVSLLVTDRVQVETLDYASPGVYLKQVHVSPERADLDVTVKLANHEPRAADLKVRTLVVDARGLTVKQAESPSKLAANGKGQVVQQITLESPHLWDGVRDPYLYRVYVEVYEGGALRDRVEQPLGLRFFSFDADEGFFLNGRHLGLHGVCRHQDRLDKGWAISEADEREDFALIREMGANALRVAHYQQSQLWYTLGDEQGVVMWAEIPFVDDALDTPLFFDNAREQLRELIRQNYNHPAIIVWGVGNETKQPAADALISQLAAAVRLEDPTRPSTYASDHADDDTKNWHTDLVAFNRYFGWYSRSADDFRAWADRAHREFPRAFLAVSEYGAGASVRQHELNPKKPEPGGHWHPEEYQAEFHEAYWKAMSARPYLWATFVWNMFDFAADQRDEGDTPGRNDKGLVTYDRKTRKDAFFWYKANWSDRPVLYITSRRFTERVESTTPVKIYSNADAVELFVNGISQGRRTGDGHVFRWADVRLKRGANTIEARAARGGEKLEDRCVWNYTPGTDSDRH
ncbi:MAG TPA: glycoside hydrolase family 2 TIM barrel-domain containing protein [Pyrinomonadaceae bacterium]|nr:glycoside hydrolase family 2 TIM barrel-domain containing protein [Pyrinomonadaceae bacterium]